MDPLGFGLGVNKIDIGHRNLGALFDKGLGNARANSATTAGYDNDLARNIHFASPAHFTTDLL